MQLTIEPYRSLTVVPTPERAFDLDTFTICFMSKDRERSIEHRKEQCDHFLIEQLREEVELMLVGLRPGHMRSTELLATTDGSGAAKVTREERGSPSNFLPPRTFAGWFFNVSLRSVQQAWRGVTTQEVAVSGDSCFQLLDLLGKVHGQKVSVNREKHSQVSLARRDVNTQEATVSRVTPASNSLTCWRR